MGILRSEADRSLLGLRRRVRKSHAAFRSGGMQSGARPFEENNKAASSRIRCSYGGCFASKLFLAWDIVSSGEREPLVTSSSAFQLAMKGSLIGSLLRCCWASRCRRACSCHWSRQKVVFALQAMAAAKLPLTLRPVGLVALKNGGGALLALHARVYLYWLRLPRINVTSPHHASLVGCSSELAAAVVERLKWEV